MSEKETKKLFSSITNIGDDIIENAQILPVKTQKSSPVWKKWGAIAACLCLVVVGAISFIHNTNHPGISDSSGGTGAAQIGGIFNGVCYYYRTDGSFWRYTVGGTSEHIFSDQIFDYDFTKAGVYYTQNLCFYFRPYSGEELRLLYSPSDPETDQVRFAIQNDGSVVLTIFDLKDKFGNSKPIAAEQVDSIRIDGETGEVLETLYENISFEESIAGIDYSLQTFYVGDRALNCVPDENYGGGYYDIVENGQSLLPDGARTDGRIYWIGDGILITVYDNPGSSGSFWQLYLLPDGREIDIGSNMFENDAIGENGRYLLYFYRDGKLGAYDIETGEKWPLETDADITIYDSVTDGTHLYSTYYGSEKITLWELIYDESGKPIGMKMLSEDICV